MRRADWGFKKLATGEISPAKVVLRRELPDRWPERGAFRKKLGIAAEAKVVLFSGRLASPPKKALIY